MKKRTIYILKLIIPNFIISPLSKLREIIRIKRVHLKWNKIFKEIKKVKQARISFFYSSPALWKFDKLCKLIANDESFKIEILICPFKRTDQDARKKIINQAKLHLEELNLPYRIIYDAEDFIRFKNEFKPNILFYPQPYEDCYESKVINLENNKDVLICYVPYFLGIINKSWIYDVVNHRILWKHYLPSQYHLHNAKELSWIKLHNYVVVGDLRGEQFFTGLASDPWKKIRDNKIRKKIIWAPHYAIKPNEFAGRTDFLWLSDFMISLAEKYKDKIQIAFKPHPGLLNSLYKMPGWGKERADAYYKKWNEMDNTQLADGEFIDLFRTSDAMIHNSGSFTADYLYVNKPVAFTTENLERSLEDLNQFGKDALKVHYIVGNKSEVENFVVEIVLGNKDNLSINRYNILNHYLIKSNKLNASELIYKDLKDSLSL